MGWSAGGVLLQAAACPEASEFFLGLSYSILSRTVENTVSAYVADFLGVPSTGIFGLFGF